MASSFQAARITSSPLSRTFHFWWVTKSCWPSPQNTCRIWPCLAIYIATAQVPAFLILPLDDYSRLLISLLGLPLPPVNIFSIARVIFKKHESLWLPCSKHSNAFLPRLEEPKSVLSSSKPYMMQLHPCISSPHSLHSSWINLLAFLWHFQAHCWFQALHLLFSPRGISSSRYWHNKPPHLFQVFTQMSFCRKAFLTPPSLTFYI